MKSQPENTLEKDGKVPAPHNAAAEGHVPAKPGNSLEVTEEEADDDEASFGVVTTEQQFGRFLGCGG